MAGSCSSTHLDFQAQVGTHAGRYIRTTRKKTTITTAVAVHDTIHFLAGRGWGLVDFMGGDVVKKGRKLNVFP
jgi:hypothetical protein